MTLLAIQTIVPGSSTQHLFTEIDLTKFRTYEFVFENLTPNVNNVSTLLVAQFGAGTMVTTANYITSRTIISPVGGTMGAAPIPQGETVAVMTLANNVGNVAPLSGRLRMTFLPVAGNYARGEGTFIYSPSTGNHIACVNQHVMLQPAAALIDRGHFFFWNGTAIVPWYSVNWGGRIMLWGM